MILSDRDLTRPPSRSSFGRIHLESVTTRLVLIIVSLFLIDRIFVRFGALYTEPNIGGLSFAPCPPFVGLCQFSVELAFYRMDLWRCFSWPFAHVAAMQLLVNVAGLHFFGPVLESHYGSRKFLIFFVLCGMGTLLAYLALWGTKHLLMDAWVPLYSSAGPVTGVLVGAAHIAPNTKTLIYGAVPIKLRTLAWIMIALTIWAVFTYAAAATPVPGGISVIHYGGAASHLGGAAMGLLLIRSPQWVKLFEWNPFRRPPPF
ncbi:MAG TPA: rhomboid family intramembrane serine protease [Tepidisphaeraceae bacterium]|nr:rhomboid family intramembrane serine protease [Tepidisphaeraceae bacterium]